MNMHRLTIENLKHIVEELEGSKDEKQQALHSKAKVELDRRLKLMGRK